MCYTNAFAVRTGVCSAIMNFTFLDNVIRKAVRSTKNTPATIVIILFHSTYERGTAM